MCVQIIKHPMQKHKSGHNVGTEADILKTSHFWCNTESVTPIDCTEKMELASSGCGKAYSCMDVKRYYLAQKVTCTNHFCS